MEDAGEDVAAEVVGAEEEARAGGLESSSGVLLEGVGRRDDAGEDGGEDREGDDGRGGGLRPVQWGPSSFRQGDPSTGSGRTGV